MLATMTRPIVTDYVHAVKPPWLLLVLFGLIVYAFPRELLPTVLLASVVVLSVGYLLNWGWDHYRNHADDLTGTADAYSREDDIPRPVY